MSELVHPIGLGMAARGEVSHVVGWADDARRMGVESVWVHDSYFERDAVTYASAIAAPTWCRKRCSRQCAEYTASTEPLSIADRSVTSARMSGDTLGSASIRSSRQPENTPGSRANPFAPLPKLAKNLARLFVCSGGGVLLICATSP